MKIVEYENEQEWLKARCGMPTASRFKDACSRLKGGEFSQVAKDYAMELVSEMLTGEPTFTHTNYDMQWGKDNEYNAILKYEQMTGEETQHTTWTLCTREIADGVIIGCTPDAVTRAGILEVKCPRTTTHIKNVMSLRDGVLPEHYSYQVNGLSMITGRPVTFITYDPRIIDESLHLEHLTLSYSMFTSNIESQLIEFMLYVRDLKNKLQ